MTAPGRREIDALTGLRAVAALGVVAHHQVPGLRGVVDERWLSILDRGYLGVDVFFTLSGFVLAYNYGGRIRSVADHLRFIGLRLARIYPLHLATLAGVLALVGAASLLDVRITSPRHYEIDHHLVLHLLLLHAWGLESGLRYNLPSWSISAEFFAYLLFPAFWAVAARVRRPLALGLGALGSGVATVAALRALGHPTLHVYLDHALVRVAGEFLAGCLAYRLFAEQGGAGRIAAGPATAVLLAVLALAVSPWADPGMAPAAPVLVYVLAAGSGPVPALLASPPVRFLGRISYAIYMTHLMVLSVLRRVLPDAEMLAAPAWLGVVAVRLAVILAVATVAWAVVERPARDALRRRLRGRRA